MANVPVSTPTNTAPSATPNAPVQTPNQSGVSAQAPVGGVKNPVAPGDQTRAPAAPVVPPRKLKLKIDGRDEELAESEVINWAQRGRSADKRFQEAAAQRKQAEDFLSLLKTDPEKVLSNPAVGVDLRKFAEDYLAKQLKKQQLTPEQQKIQELQDQLRSKDEEKQTEQRQREQQEFQAMTTHYQQEFDRSIPEAISNAGLPKTPFTVERMTRYMINAIQNGIDIAPSNVVEMVRQDYISDLTSITTSMDGDTLLKLFGEQIANKIRKADLARLRKSTIPQYDAAPTPSGEADPGETFNEVKPVAPRPRQAPAPKPQTLHEWRAEMDKKRHG